MQHATNALARAIVYLMAGLLLAALLIAFAGCSPAKRLAKISAAHPDAAATLCAQLFPVRESTRVEVRTVTDTAYVAGPVVRVDCDSVERSAHDTGSRIIMVPCPPQSVITKLVVKDSIVRVESTAALAGMRAERDAVRVELAGMEAKRGMWRLIAVIAIAYIAIRIALRLWLKINLP